MTDDFLIVNPVLPCVCGHLITAHGDEGGGVRGWWDYDSNECEVWREEQEQPRPVCYECGPGDCCFVEMDNLEYLEHLSHDKG
jgi:hypothetical protein